MNGIFYLMSKIMHKIPESMINIPNKRYWFETEERKKESINRIVVILPSTAFLLNILWSFVYESILHNNTGRGLILPAWGMFVYIAIMVILILGYTILSFKKPKT